MSILLLATAWGSRHGGVNAFNHDLCFGLAQAAGDGVSVLCLVPQASEADIAAAAQQNVRLLTCGGDGLDAARAKLCLDQAGCSQAVQWVIGHDIHTGPAADLLARLLSCRWAIIHHMDFDAYAAFKYSNGQRAAEKTAQQTDLLRRADCCLAVGPLLRDSAQRKMGRMPVEIAPGLPLITAKKPENKVGPFTALICGRMDAEDDPIKQGSLAVAGFAKACDWGAKTAGAPPRLGGQRNQMRIIGLSQAGGDTEKALIALSQTYGGDNPPLLSAEPFTEQRKILWDKVADAHLAFMPSWHEGFGLTGWEAIAAEVPLIVSTESGLHKLIAEQFTYPAQYVWPIKVTGQSGTEENFTAKDLDNISEAVRAVAANYDEAVQKARHLRQALQGFTWQQTGQTVLKGLGLDGNATFGTAAQDIPQSPKALDMRCSTWQEEWRGLDSMLLRPEHRMVPFTGALQGVRDQIVAWAQDQSQPQKLMVRLYSARGGSGKTRLSIECCAALQGGDGWTVGFLPDGWRGDDLVRNVQALLRQHQRLFMVMDYAETRRPDLLRLLDVLVRAPVGHRIRVLLLGRGQGEWWDALRQEPEATELVRSFLSSLTGACGPYPLPMLDVTEQAQRQEHYQAALGAFSPYLDCPNPQPAPMPDLRGDIFSQPLFLHLAALAALHGQSLDQEQSLLTAALEREENYWRRMLAEESLPENLLQPLQQAVALLVLVGGHGDGQQVEQMLHMIPALKRQSDEVRERLVRGLKRLYRREDGVDALRPDMLGEWLVRQVVRQDAAIIKHAFGEKQPIVAVHNALTVLARLAQRGEMDWLQRALGLNFTPRIVKCALRIAVEVGQPVDWILAEIVRDKSKAPDGVVEKLIPLLPNQTVALAESKLALLERWAEILRPRARNKGDIAGKRVGVLTDISKQYLQRRDLGKAEKAYNEARQLLTSIGGMRDLGNKLQIEDRKAKLLRCQGHHAEALELSAQVVQWARQRAESGGEKETLDLVEKLRNYNVVLSNAGQFPEAISIIEEAIDIFQPFYEKNQHNHADFWFAMQNNFAADLSCNGRKQKSVDIFRDAEKFYHENASILPDRYNPDLAMAWHNLAESLGDQCDLTAFEWQKKANDLYGVLASFQPSRFMPDCIIGQNSLAALYRQRGEYDLALAVGLEAEQQAAKLKDLPEFYGIWLSSLGNLAGYFAELGKVEEALCHAERVRDLRANMLRQSPHLLPLEFFQSQIHCASILLQLCRYDAVEMLISDLKPALLPYISYMPENVCSMLGAVHALGAELALRQGNMAQAMLENQQAMAYGLPLYQQQKRACLVSYCRDSLMGDWLNGGDGGDAQRAMEEFPDYSATQIVRFQADVLALQGRGEQALERLLPHFRRCPRQLVLSMQQIGKSLGGLPPDVEQLLSESLRDLAVPVRKRDYLLM